MSKPGDDVGSADFGAKEIDVDTGGKRFEPYFAFEVGGKRIEFNCDHSWSSFEEAREVCMAAYEIMQNPNKKNFVYDARGIKGDV